MTTLVRLRKALGWTLLALFVGFMAFCVYWRIDGGRWERVETPSMGTTAPVGSLLWVKPVDFQTLDVGDFITFYPPGNREITYSHEVYAVNGDGTLGTKGVIPGPDSWAITADDVVGEVQMTWIGAGWIVKAAPVLIIGGLLVGAVWSAVRPIWRSPALLVGGAIVLAVAISLHRPLLNAQQIASSDAGSQTTTVTYVGTGLLPVKLTEPSGNTLVLRAGEVGELNVARPDVTGRMEIEMVPNLSWWWWAVVIGVCFLPALVSILNKRRDRAAASAADAATDGALAAGAGVGAAGGVAGLAASEEGDLVAEPVSGADDRQNDPAYDRGTVTLDQLMSRTT